mgnify:CR=1 FL=1
MTEGTGRVIEAEEILRILPHRYPFLLVDRIVEIEPPTRAVGIKNVTINEPFFQGHWPKNPVMPGVLILEAMAQVSSVLTVSPSRAAARPAAATASVRRRTQEARNSARPPRR